MPVLSLRPEKGEAPPGFGRASFSFPQYANMTHLRNTTDTGRELPHTRANSRLQHTGFGIFESLATSGEAIARRRRRSRTARLRVMRAPAGRLRRRGDARAEFRIRRTISPAGRGGLNRKQSRLPRANLDDPG
jgi:hypothetical protein